MIVDVQHHWMPREHVENTERYVRAEDHVIREVFKGENIVRVVRDDASNIAIRGDKRYRLDKQIRDMDRAGVDVAVLSLATWQDWTSMSTCRFINDQMAKVVSEYPDRFAGLAHVPPAEPGAADELDRAIKDLGLKGISINTNWNGMYPDHPSHEDFYRKANELRLTIFIHAAGAPGEFKNLRDYSLNISVGRAFDHTLAIARLLYSGIPKKYPNIKFVNGHLGGFFFALRERLTGYSYGFTRELYPIFESSKKPFEDDLKRFYYDTAPPLWSTQAMMCAIKTLGANHLVLGSDYPIEDWYMKGAVSVISKLKIGTREKAQILGRNAAKLFGIKP